MRKLKPMYFPLKCSAAGRVWIKLYNLSGEAWNWILACYPEDNFIMLKRGFYKIEFENSDLLVHKYSNRKSVI